MKLPNKVTPMVPGPKPKWIQWYWNHPLRMREALEWLETGLTASQPNLSGKEVTGTNIHSSILHANSTFYFFVIPIYMNTVGSCVVMVCQGSASED